MVTSDKVGNMIEGQYSNYVLQKMMDTAPPEVNPALMEVLRYKCFFFTQKLMNIENPKSFFGFRWSYYYFYMSFH